MHARALCLSSVLLACSASTTPPVPPAQPHAPVAQGAVWARFGELSGLAAAGDSFPNQGHAGAGASAWVKVSPAALHTYQGWVQDSTLPMGTLLAMFHAAGTSRATASIYVMEKTPSGWRYGVVGADGRTLAAGNGVSVPSPAACAGCHAAAPADSVFGPPRTR